MSFEISYLANTVKKNFPHGWAQSWTNQREASKAFIDNNKESVRPNKFV